MYEFIYIQRRPEASLIGTCSAEEGGGSDDFEGLRPGVNTGVSGEGTGYMVRDVRGWCSVQNIVLCGNRHALGSTDFHMSPKQPSTAANAALNPESSGPQCREDSLSSSEPCTISVTRNLGSEQLKATL